jgi:hypothetical protein
MYFDGYGDKGRCAAGGLHEGHGDDPRTYNFVLPHPITPTIGLQAVGGYIKVRGRGFTPNNNVTVRYEFDDQEAVNTLTQGHQSAGTDTYGEFTSDIEGQVATGVAVAVTDDVTGTVARDSLP